MPTAAPHAERPLRARRQRDSYGGGGACRHVGRVAHTIHAAEMRYGIASIPRRTDGFPVSRLLLEQQMRLSPVLHADVSGAGRMMEDSSFKTNKTLVF
ncbi:hypothetical protein BM1_05321 [Bipolaris maydis]|nr:hypothetical protein BM1_05321 [Bipolaris maydis]